jgi:hypothetical protein
LGSMHSAYWQAGTATAAAAHLVLGGTPLSGAWLCLRPLQGSDSTLLYEQH